MSMTTRIATRHIKKAGWGAENVADLIDKANELLRDAVDTLEGDPEAMELAEVGRIIKHIKSKVSKDVEGLATDLRTAALKARKGKRATWDHPAVAGSRVGMSRSHMSLKMDLKLKDKIGDAFLKVGLDGNFPFRKPTDGYVRAVDVLADNGIELDDIASSHLLGQPNGRMTLHLAYSNKADAFSPVEINNSMLVLSWHRRDSGTFEVIAYLS